MFKKILSAAFLVFGLALLSKGMIDFAKRQGIVTSQEVIISQVIAIEEPTKILLPELGIELPIHITEIIDRKWPTSETGVSYIKDSGRLGVSGNLIMYGHNWKNLLGDLNKVKVGDSIILSEQNGTDYSYQVAYIAEVSANDTSILADTVDERLTLYTCSGFLDQRRLVVVAKRV